MRIKGPREYNVMTFGSWVKCSPIRCNSSSHGVCEKDYFNLSLILVQNICYTCRGGISFLYVTGRRFQLREQTCPSHACKWELYKANMYVSTLRIIQHSQNDCTKMDSMSDDECPP